ncbi:hypothetical protein M427DRAFT_37594 [Gonapodya prolifera JEL478]|uniref:Bacteriophage/plasmid primase P4 C-terminal domain-containing protein n=1 Tax=Gonapodya prolifera (strain JEL478) TaxID=1344416 RepID=A0A139A0B0_GONPJ|nr:hypothetical protein M427DRAFT_37594 [Gonapodya prolifera JEL478]|eukprot:KXS10217.1 hypothetical protein M427DRAFT_37594 [Gonapodya prolifera JEL478]
MSTLKSRAKVIPGLDIDFRGDGGMIIVAPTTIRRPDGTTSAYTWLDGKALVGQDAKTLTAMPNWLFNALNNSGGQARKLKQATSGAIRSKAAGSSSHSVSDVEQKSGEGLDAGIATYIEESFSVFPQVLGMLQTHGETLVIPTSEKRCMFKRREHSTNHQYFFITKKGEITRRCYSDKCSGKTFGKRTIPDSLLASLKHFFEIAVPMDPELTKRAEEEAQLNIAENFDGNEGIVVKHVNSEGRHKIVGTMKHLNGCAGCWKCGNLLTVTTVAEGMYILCESCGFRLPQKFNFPVPSEYTNLTKFFVFVQNNITNNITNNYGDVSGLDVSFDEVYPIFEDPGLNACAYNALDGTAVHIAELFREKQVQKITSILTALHGRELPAIKERCVPVFYELDENFADKLDTNRDLIRFDNGVFDLKENRFRQGRMDNYLSMSVGYSWSDESHPEIESKVTAFFEDIQPDIEQRAYLFIYLSTMISGCTQDEIFTIFNGRTRNGKSVLADLMKVTLGDDCVMVDSKMATADRPALGSPQPDLLELRGKRAVFISEPQKSAHSH